MPSQLLILLFLMKRFQELPEHEKEVYQEMARQEKANKKYHPVRNDRMDCTGEYISVC